MTKGKRASSMDSGSGGGDTAEQRSCRDDRLLRFLETRETQGRQASLPDGVRRPHSNDGVGRGEHLDHHIVGTRLLSCPPLFENRIP